MNANPSPFRNAAERRADREAKRDAVLLAAVRMFNERGFHATSLDDVAASLGVSKPTIYHYLGNKEQVLLSCLGRALDELWTSALAAREARGNGAERLKSFLASYAEFNMTDFGRCLVITRENELSEDGARQFRADKRRIHEMMRDMIEDGRNDGSIACDDANLLAFTIAGALNWPALWFRPDADHAASDLARSMIAMLAAGMDPR